MKAPVRPVLLAGTLLVASWLPTQTVAQGRREVIQGRVTTESGATVPSAHVIITRGPDRAIFEAATDRGGLYTVTIDLGGGDYLVYVAPPPGAPLQTFRKRVTRQAPTDTVFVVDAVLRATAGQQLSVVRVQERRTAPARADDRSNGAGASEVRAGGVAALTTPAEAGDLNALAATLSSVASAPDGVSVFGVPATQNAVTLDGLAFPGVALPADAQTTVRVVSSTFDPSRGWFGGAETRVDLTHDFLYSSFRTSTSLDARLLQSGSALAARSGRELNNLRGGVGATGFTYGGKLSYNTSAQFTRRTSDMATLMDMDRSVLQHAGVARDSVERFLASARALGIQTSTVPPRPGTSTNGGVLLLSVSSLSADRDTFKPKRHVGRVSVFLAREEQEGRGLFTLGTPSLAAHGRLSLATAQASLSSFLRPGVLQDLRTAISTSNHRTAPYFAVPRAVVDVSSDDLEGGGLVALAAGGAASGEASGHRVTWETQSDTRFYVGAVHRLKLSAGLRFDALDAVSRVNANGTYAFSSLSEFAGSRPFSFSRLVDAPVSSGRLWNGYVALGDYWRPTPSLELLYGARADGTVLAERATPNAAVAEGFGARTDHAPERLHVSPRVGFTWTRNRVKPGGYVVNSDHGSFLVPAVGVLRGGIGEFRSLITPSTIANASTAGGQAGVLREIVCAGTALATPDWSRFALSPETVPRDCPAAPGAMVTRDTAPTVRLLGPDYTAPRSWRANLSWTSYHSALVWTIEGAYSRNMNQLGAIDLNFTNAPAFTLTEETHRPVYASVLSIVPTSGLVSARDARRQPAFGAVRQSQSNLSSDALQGTLTLMPDLTKYARSRLFASLAYTYANVRSQFSGFSGTTYSSPLQREWARTSYVPLHSFRIQGSMRSPVGMLTLYGLLASGTAFTPMIERDVNGDGLANDRAFVFDPATAKDSAVGAGMHELLLRGSPEVRSCLRRQLAHPAAPNSCTGPWTSTFNARLGFNTGSATGWMKRVSVALYASNIPAGLDQLLHGARLHGWGDAGLPDQVLLRPTGFDPSALRFRYAVNPRFGETRPIYSTPRAPFRLAVDIRLDLGASADQQILDRNLQSGRAGRAGAKRTVRQMRQFYLRAVPDPFAIVLALTDSLLLTQDQIRTALEGQARYAARVDTAVTALATWLESLPDRYNAADALRHQEDTFTAALNFGREEIQRALTPTLNRIQVNLLPWPADVMFRATGALALRDIRR